MYLKTPKRYSAKGRRRHLFSFRWLWLYLLAPVIIVGGALAWDYRADLSGAISKWAGRNIKIGAVQPTPTPAIPAADLTRVFGDALRSGKINNAISALGGLGDLSPNDPTLFSTLSRLILLRGDPNDQGKIKQALAAADKAINANPEVPDGWIMAALALDKSLKPEEALPFALHAKDLDSENPLLLAVLAEIYYDLGRYDQSTTLVEQAITTAKATVPMNALALMYAHWVKGLTLLNQSGQAAQTSFEEAWRTAQVDSSLPAGFIAQYLWSFYVAQKPDELVDILKTANQRDKDDPMIPFYLGRIYVNQVNWEQARPYFAQCLDIDPTQVRCLRYFAQVSYQQGNFKAASDNAQKAVDLGSTEPEAYLVAGLGYIFQVPPSCDVAVPLLQKGYILNDENPNTDAQRKGQLRSQFDGGLRSCNGAPIAPTPAPTGTLDPFATPVNGANTVPTPLS